MRKLQIVKLTSHILWFLLLIPLLVACMANQNETPKINNKIILDNDFDGVPNTVDVEINTVWLKDTTQYQLRNFVDATGALDRGKVDSLCNCFAIGDSLERTKIACKDNPEYFFFDGKLWHFDESNRFYDKDSNEVLRKPNDISRFHQEILDKFLENRASNNEQTNINP